MPSERLVANVVDGTARSRTLADFRYGVGLRRRISRAISNDRQQCERLYGSGDLYAASKRQIATRDGVSVCEYAHCPHPLSMQDSIAIQRKGIRRWGDVGVARSMI